MDEPTENMYQLECLPIEVVSSIAKYLSVKDLCSCCETSSTMRELFNDNGIWRPRFDAERVKYLRNTPAKVEPKFMIPDFNGSSLSPLPECRVSFMYENHLWNNWRLGKYKKEKIINKDSKDKNYRVRFHMFQTNDCVIAQLDDVMEFLDVKEMPATDALRKLPFGTRFYDSVIYTNKSMIVTALKSSVHVFHLDFETKQFALKNVFFFENSQKEECSGITELKKLLDLKKTTQNVKRIVMGSTFVGSFLGDSMIHVWNLETGEKLKEVKIPIKQYSIQDMHISDTMNLVLSVYKAYENITFFAYDLKKLEYLSFNKVFTVNPLSSCVYKDLVVILSDNTIHIFNYVTSDVYVHPVSAPGATTLHLLKNTVMYVSDGRLNQLNLSTKKTVTFPFTRFELLSDKFIQVQENWNYKILEFDATLSTLKQTSMNLYFSVCGFFLNKACTRYIVREDVGYLLNFW